MNILNSTIYSGLGVGTKENFNQVIQKNTNIRAYEHEKIGLYMASFCQEYPTLSKELTKFENLACYTILKTLEGQQIKPSCKNLAIVLSTTKGNIDLLQTDKPERFLPEMGKKIQHYLQNPNPIHIISNACISGVQAFQYAEYLLQTFEFVLICGTDILTEFVLSGFHSFHALSSKICKPFDSQRNGLNLGEASAAILLSQKNKSNISIIGCASSNDANHISGPSRTGEGLSKSIQRTLHKAQISAHEIQAISAHGTATLYNDEMESLAFQTSNLLHADVFSLKANFGHTLGASGVIEVILSAESLKNQCLMPSLGFDETGTSVKLNVLKNPKNQLIKNILKTSSGFGGGNSSLILQFHENH